MTAVSIRDIRKVYGKDTVILDDIDLEVASVPESPAAS